MIVFGIKLDLVDTLVIIIICLQNLKFVYKKLKKKKCKVVTTFFINNSISNCYDISKLKTYNNDLYSTDLSY